MRTLAFIAIAAAGVAGTADAAEVSRSVTVDASAAEVWQLVGPFCSISEWFPGIDSCTEDDIDGKPHRRLVADDGAVFLEERLSADNDAMSYGYAIVEGPLPVQDYEATFSVGEAGDKAVITWQSSFEPNGASEEEAAAIIGGIYDIGLMAVQDHFAE